MNKRIFANFMCMSQGDVCECVRHMFVCVCGGHGCVIHGWDSECVVFVSFM